MSPAAVRQAFTRLSGLPGMSAAVPFMVAALLMLPLIGVGLALAGAQIARGEVRGPVVLATNHLITLGWGSLAAMGSLHQLFPAMVGAPLRPGRAALVQLGISLAGALVIITGFLTRRHVLLAPGGVLTWIGMLLFIWLMLRVIRVRRRWTTTCTGVTLALGAFAFTVTWGLLVGVNTRWVFWKSLLTYAGLGVHAPGLGGWFAQLVVAVSYYLLPRFTDHRVLEKGRLGPILVLLNGGVLFLIAAAAGGGATLARIGVLLMAAAGGLYAVDLAPVLRVTRRGQPDLTLSHWRVIWVYTVLLSAGGAAWALGLSAWSGRTVAEFSAVLLLTGWIPLAIMGQLYKVSPFLMWYYRFAVGMGPLDIPRLEAPYYPRAGIPPFYLTVAGSALLAGGRLLESPALGAIGGLLWLGGAVTFTSLLGLSWMRAAPAPARGTEAP